MKNIIFYRYYGDVFLRRIKLVPCILSFAGSSLGYRPTLCYLFDFFFTYLWSHSYVIACRLHDLFLTLSQFSCTGCLKLQ